MANLNLVGYSKFVRTNPKTDRFPVHSFHHIEFFSSDATTAASRFSFSLGIPIHSISNTCTHISILLKHPHHSLSFLFTSPSSSPALNPTPPSIPSFTPSFSHSFIASHSLAVRAVSLSVSDAFRAFEVSVENGAVPAFAPVELGNGFQIAEVELYGDVVLRFVKLGDGDDGLFLPGFERVEDVDEEFDYGLRSLDHAVGNVPELAPVVSYITK